MNNMKLIQKILLTLAILAIVVILIIALLFFIFVNPNRFKNQIIHEVYAQTGVPIQIQGPIEWIAAPQFGLRIRQVLLPSAQVQQADVYLQWQALFSRKVKVQELFLKEFATETDKIIFKKPQHFKISGDLGINFPQQSFNIENLKINSEDIQAFGKVTGEKLEKSVQFSGQLKIPHFQGWTDFPVQINNAEVHFKTDSNQSFSGDVKAENFSVKNYSVNNLSSPFNANIQKIHFTGIKGQFAAGEMAAKVIISYFTIKPRYEIEIQLHRVETSQLLHSEILSGPADLNANLSLNENLNGKINFIMRNGVLNYINLLKQIHDVRNFLKSNRVEISGNATPFSQLTASGVIENNLFTNHDLSLQSDALQARGEGSINFANGQLNYILNVDAYGLKVPLKIKGTLNKPKVKFDLGSFKLTLPSHTEWDKTLHVSLKSLFGHHHHK